MGFYKNVTNTYITPSTALADGDRWMVISPKYSNDLPIEVRDFLWKLHDETLLVQVKRRGVFLGGSTCCNGCIFYKDSPMNDSSRCIASYFNAPSCVQSTSPNRGEQFVFKKAKSL